MYILIERPSIDQTNSPNYLPRPTIVCYDCHSSGIADNDPNMAAFVSTGTPQDIAFGDDGTVSTGIVGYYETKPPTATPPAAQAIASGTVTGGHFIKTTMTTGISQGDKLPCDACRDPHSQDSSNEALIKNPLSGKEVDDLKASTNSREGTGNGRAICNTCHGYGRPADTSYTPSVTFKDIDPDWVSTVAIVYRPITISAHRDNDTVPCTNCHRHNEIVAGGNAGRNTVLRENVNIIFNPAVAFPGGTTINNGSEATETFDVVDGPVCFVGCHNPVVFYPNNESPNLINKAVWMDDDLVCIDCHDNQGAVINRESVNGVAYKQGTIRLIDNDNSAAVSFSWSLGSSETSGVEPFCLSCHDGNSNQPFSTTATPRLRKAC